jgi:peptidoglycan/LPS O-acetylase OafA/YrhL
LVIAAGLYFLVGMASRLLLLYAAGTVTRPLSIALGAGCFVLILHDSFQFLPFAIWAVIFAIICTRRQELSGVDAFFVKQADTLLQNVTMLWLGRISYSVYLSHAIVLVAVQYVILPLYPEISRLGCAVLLTLAGVPLTIWASHVLYTYV